MTCETCKHWLRGGVLARNKADDGQPMFGACRAKPPVIIEAMVQGRFQMRPADDALDRNDVEMAILEASCFPITPRSAACAWEVGA